MNMMSAPIILNVTKAQKAAFTAFTKSVETMGLGKGIIVGSIVSAGVFVAGTVAGTVIMKSKDDGCCRCNCTSEELEGTVEN